MSPQFVLQALGDWVAIECRVRPADAGAEDATNGFTSRLTRRRSGVFAARSTTEGSVASDPSGAAPDASEGAWRRRKVHLPEGHQPAPEAQPENVGWSLDVFDSFTAFVSDNGIPAPLSSIEQRMLAVVVRRWLRGVALHDHMPLLCALTAYVAPPRSPILLSTTGGRCMSVLLSSTACSRLRLLPAGTSRRCPWFPWMTTALVVLQASLAPRGHADLCQRHPRTHRRAMPRSPILTPQVALSVTLPTRSCGQSTSHIGRSAWSV